MVGAREDRAIDLTVAATPLYFASMAYERRRLTKRAAAQGASGVEYIKPDTLASLAMGNLSLLAPFAARYLIKQVLPGKGRFPKVLVRTAVAATLATTVADWIANHESAASSTTESIASTASGQSDTRDEAELAAREAGGNRATRRARWRGIADRARRIGGPLAIGAGGLAFTTTVTDRFSPERVWRHNGGRDLGEGLAAWVLAIAGWDFIYYWNHRLMHEVRALWAIHVVHHSSERYNLSTALRQPVADVLGAFIPQGLMCLLGVRPKLVEQARGVNLLYQYWIHTDTIDRLGRGEALLTTPSHHRVHHGSNPRYIDRNHGSILILWDKLFGTFEREREPVVYGLTKNIGTYNPARIASHEYVDIVRDVSGSTNWIDRLSFVLRGPGWAYARHAAGAPTAPTAGRDLDADTAPDAVAATA